MGVVSLFPLVRHLVAISKLSSGLRLSGFVLFTLSLLLVSVGWRRCVAQAEREVVQYARRVLDAMGIENGPGHMEVRRQPDAVMLQVFFVGSRCRTSSFRERNDFISNRRSRRMFICCLRLQSVVVLWPRETCRKSARNVFLVCFMFIVLFVFRRRRVTFFVCERRYRGRSSRAVYEHVSVWKRNTDG